MRLVPRVSRPGPVTIQKPSGKEPLLIRDDAPGANAPAVIGAYSVLQLIGHGALGSVYRAYHPQSNRFVAVKVFSNECLASDPAAVAAALETLVSSRFESARSLSFEAAGLDPAGPYAVMRFVDDGALEPAMRWLAPAPVDRVIELLSRLARAIDDGWRSGQGHGSLNPRDVFVTSAGEFSGVTGLGVAQIVEPFGCPAPRRVYTAPERESGAAWDQRADVFSLGAIAHELLTRRRPSGPGEQDGELGAEVPAAQRVQIRRVLARALAADPADRFASAVEFVDALGRTAGFRESPVPVPAMVPDVPAAESAADESPSLARVAADPAASHDDLRLDHPSAVDLPLADLGLTASAGTVDGAVPPEDRLHGQRAWTPAFDEPTGGAPRRPWLAIGGIAGVLAGGVLVFTLLHTPRTPQDGGRPATSQAPGATQRAAGSDAATPPAPGPEGRDVPAAPSDPPPASVTPPPATSPAAPATAAPAPADQGRVIVRSEPRGAMVTIDGRLVGTTPLMASGLELGAHEVQVARPGFIPHVETVRLSTAAPLRSLTIALRGGVGTPVEALPTGTIDLDSHPRGARVIIDGRFVGHSPVRLPEIAPGAHLVSLELPGQPAVTQRVQVVAGQISRVRITLD